MALARYEKTTAGSSVFDLNPMFSTQACFLWENGLFFDLMIPELRVEKKKPIKSTRATPGARAQAPPCPPSAPRPAPGRTGRMPLG
jgi:hypothetical protein